MESFEASCCPTAITAVAVILLTIIYYYMKNRNILPGPTGLPYIGLYPFLSDENVCQKLEEYKKRYGDLFSFTYSGKLWINVGSIKAFREIYINNSHNFADKYSDFNVVTYMVNNGLLVINGEAWKILRKFFIQRFRDYGLNTVKDDFAGPLYDSIDATLKDLKDLNGRPVNITDLLTQRCTVVMRKVVFGEKGVTDEELRQMMTSYSAALDATAGVNFLLIGLFGRLIFSVSPKHRRYLKHHDRFFELVSDCVARVERSMNEEYPSCMIDDYYKERNERRRKNDPTWKIFTDETLVSTVLQFIGDGVLGVAAFIAGFLNVLIEYPEEQDKLYAELMEVVGPNRQPTIEDKSNLPYVNAFMNEALRNMAFLIMFPGVECTKDVTIRGYRIPKGAIALSNFWSAHHDPEVFDEPLVFKPSRYMPKPGKPMPESPVSFGMGKRSCTGELFVMTQSFLFLTNIVMNFRIVSSNDSSTSLNMLMAGKLELSLKPRNENSSAK